MKKAPASKASLAVFSVTLFLSAGIMFALEPMIGKMLLPLVGGTPAGWVVALAFFQVMLLAGYFLAHAFSTIAPRGHGAAWLLALLAGTAFLPIGLAGHGLSSPDAWSVFCLLTVAVGVPFVVLSTASSTIQRLFTVTSHGGANDPYFLYAASNLGSFAGLLFYPLLAEPFLTLDQQAQLLQWGYFGLIGLGLVCLWLAGGKTEKKPKKKDTTPAPALAVKLRWLLLSFVPSSLLMGVTAYITTELFSAPMMWILPLGLYLLTFVIAFGKAAPGLQRVLEILHPFTVLFAVFLMAAIQPGEWMASMAGAGFCLVVFTIAALSCHMQMASLRPSSRYLTGFYLMVALGGALGGTLNAFIVPALFNKVLEFPLALAASLLLHPDFRPTSRAGLGVIALLAVSLLLVNAPPLLSGIDVELARKGFIAAIVLAGAGALFMAGEKAAKLQPVALFSLGIFIIGQYALADPSEVARSRSFYGAITLYEKQENIDGKPHAFRYMRHGNTIHGLQVQGKAFEKTKTAYYSEGGPLGDVFGIAKPKSVVVLGLGAGTVNCYEAPGRAFAFIDIDPGVIRHAQEDFTFLFACGGKQKPEIVLGDGRLELEKMKGRRFGLVIVDVFTADAIPSHLVTEEAFALYREKLSKGGLVAINISNRYFPLWDLVTKSAQKAGFETRLKLDVRKEMPSYAQGSLWIVLAPKGEMPEAFSKKKWQPVTPPDDFRPWTDSYSNLIGLLMRKPSQPGAKQ